MSNLAKAIKEKIISGAVEPSNLRTIQRELGFIRLHQDEIEFVLSQFPEGMERAESEIKLNLELFRDCHLESVSLAKLQADNPFYFRVHPSEFDPFNYLLIASDYANYLCAVRDQARNPREFGGDETWFVFCMTIRSIAKYRVRGNIAALRQQFPDEMTRAIMRDSGVDITPLKSPRLILKV